MVIHADVDVDVDVDETWTFLHFEYYEKLNENDTWTYSRELPAKNVYKIVKVFYKKVGKSFVFKGTRFDSPLDVTQINNANVHVDIENIVENDDIQNEIEPPNIASLLVKHEHKLISSSVELLIDVKLVQFQFRTVKIFLEQFEKFVTEPKFTSICIFTKRKLLKQALDASNIIFNEYMDRTLENKDFTFLHLYNLLIFIQDDENNNQDEKKGVERLKKIIFKGHVVNSSPYSFFENCPKGFKISRVPADGDCFYHSLIRTGREVLNKDFDIETLKNHVTKIILEDKDLREDLINEWIDHDTITEDATNMDEEMIIENVKNQWATSTTIHICALFLELKINVHRFLCGKWQIQSFPSEYKYANVHDMPKLLGTVDILSSGLHFDGLFSI